MSMEAILPSEMNSAFKMIKIVICIKTLTTILGKYSAPCHHHINKL